MHVDLSIPTRHQRHDSTRVPKLLVLHSMAEFVRDETGQIWYCTDFLRKKHLSCHFFVMPDGRLVKSVPTGAVAYHAKGVNLHSIGVEFMVAGVHDWISFVQAIAEPTCYTLQQYKTGLEVVSSLERVYQQFDIKTHSQLDPERKRDPGRGFKLDWFLEEVERTRGQG